MFVFRFPLAKSITFIAAACVLCVANGKAQQTLKPRIVVLTDITTNDIEPDDTESIIRLFAHADLFEIEALIATTGWSNTGGKEHPELIHEAIDAYEKDLPNLSKRSNQNTFFKNEERQTIGYWPSPNYLRSRTMLGSKKMGVNTIGKDNRSEGSDWIVKMADEKDPRPIWVLVWGGGNTVAQAIWQVQQERTESKLKAFLQKIRVYTITDQDRPYSSYGDNGNKVPYTISSHQWMREEFGKDLLFIWDESAWFFQNDKGKANWDQYATHIQQHGNLGKLYPKYKWGVEGDTPSFLHVFPNGLSDPDNPSSVGWGGYFEWWKTRDSVTSAFTNYREINAGPISRKYEERFYPAIFNSFAARMDWAKDGAGNRNPVVVVNKQKGLDAVKLKPKAGIIVTLDATGSYDPDGHSLTYNWWVVPEAGDYLQPLSIIDSQTKIAQLQIPLDAVGKTIHIVCEVEDTGIPALTSYRRIVINPVK